MENLALFELEVIRDGRDEHGDVQGGAFEGLGASGFGVEEGEMEGFGFVGDADFAGELRVSEWVEIWVG